MKLIGFRFFPINVVTIFHHFLQKGSIVHYNFSHRVQERTPFIKNYRFQRLIQGEVLREGGVPPPSDVRVFFFFNYMSDTKIFVTRGSHVITQYICLTDQA